MLRRSLLDGLSSLKVLDLITAIDWTVAVAATVQERGGRLENGHPAVALLVASSRRGSRQGLDGTDARNKSSAPVIDGMEALNKETSLGG